MKKQKDEVFMTSMLGSDFLALGFSPHGIDLNELEKDISPKPVSVFKAWLEDWEKQAIKKEDDYNHHRLVCKCAGLCWKDPDNNCEIVHASDKRMHFHSAKSRSERGYHVIGLGPNYNPLNPRSEDYNLWQINHQLFGLIWEYYTENRDPCIFVETKLDSFRKDCTWNFDFDGIAAAEAERKRAADDGDKKPAAKKRSRN